MRSGGKLRSSAIVAQALLILWLLIVNVLFYLQFRALALSRLPHWLTRWHL